MMPTKQTTSHLNAVIVKQKKVKLNEEKNVPTREVIQISVVNTCCATYTKLWDGMAIIYP